MSHHEIKLTRWLILKQQTQLNWFNLRKQVFKQQPLRGKGRNITEVAIGQPIPVLSHRPPGSFVWASLCILCWKQAYYLFCPPGGGCRPPQRLFPVTSAFSPQDQPGLPSPTCLHGLLTSGRFLSLCEFINKMQIAFWREFSVEADFWLIGRPPAAGPLGKVWIGKQTRAGQWKALKGLHCSLAPS